MSLSSAEHVRLISDQYMPTFRGNAMYKLRAARTDGGVTQAMLQALVDATPRPGAEPVPKYAHPARNKDVRRGGGALTTTEHALLTRLPTDPEKVSMDDSSWLSRLSDDVSAVDHPADARLLASYWGPVAAVHDRKAAAVVLQNALNSPGHPIVPTGMQASLTAAIQREVPGLDAGEASLRAKKMIEGAVVDHQDRRATTIAEARRKAQP